MNISRLLILVVSAGRAKALICVPHNQEHLQHETFHRVLQI